MTWDPGKKQVFSLKLWWHISDANASQQKARNIGTIPLGLNKIEFPISLSVYQPCAYEIMYM